MEILAMVKGLKSWVKPEDVPTPMALISASSRVEKQPLGVTLCLGPFNYPMMLLLAPMLGAIAAGCPVVAKPSELCPELAELIAFLVPKYLDTSAVKIVNGGVETSKALLAQRWDNILFTGSSRVGKIVAAAAAKHLTPTTLELGGKCPVFLAEGHGPLADVAKKLVWGRLLNCGQSCVAPEYVLAPRNLVRPLADALQGELTRMYGSNPAASASLARLISPESARRIGKLLEDHGGDVVCGGTVHPEDRFVQPCIIIDPDPDSDLMQEEVFGPVLVLVSVDSIEDALAYARPKGMPLASYIFSNNQAIVRKVLDGLPSGNVAINDVMMQFANPHMPFGGVGGSGHGSMHGKYYFECCTQQRAVMAKGSGIGTRLLDLQVDLRSAPYQSWKLFLIRFALSGVLPALPPRYGYKTLWLAVCYAAYYLLVAYDIYTFVEMSGYLLSAFAVATAALI
jgi:aldehyde dehydrogenase (NAD+)